MPEKTLPEIENTQDEADIISGENQNESIFTKDKEPMEDEPEEFIEGKVDVVEQMKRAATEIVPDLEPKYQPSIEGVEK